MNSGHLYNAIHWTNVNASRFIIISITINTRLFIDYKDIITW